MAECGTMDFTSVGKFPNSILRTKGDCITEDDTAHVHTIHVCCIYVKWSHGIFHCKSNPLALGEEIET